MGRIFCLVLLLPLLTLFLGHNPVLRRCFLDRLYLKPAHLECSCQ